MNRRDLIKKIALGAPALAFAVAGPITMHPSDSCGEFMFHGWRVKWTGWKRIENMDVQAGQWVAYSTSLNGWHLYSSWPGDCGPFVNNNMFDLCLRNDQILPTMQMPESELDWCKSECLERLKRLIVKVGPPPLDIEKFREEML
jgi:hypothetical protein